MKTIYYFLLCMTIMSGAAAQNAGNWTFNSTVSGTASSNLTVGNATVGSSIPSLTTNNTIEYYGEGGWPAGALDANAYVQFKLTASSGYYLVLNTVKMSMRRSNTGTPTGSGPNNWSLRSSLDNYASDLATGSNLDYNLANFTVTLPSSFHAIPSTVTFRLYGYNMTVSSSGGVNRFVWDNFSVVGSAVSGVLAQQGVDLSAKLNSSGDVSVTWAADGFEAGAVYTLERSSNGNDYAAIYKTESLNLSDTYNDRAAPVSGNIFYRVAVTNPDGGGYVSPVVAVKQAAGQTTGASIRGVVAGSGSVRTLLHIGDAGNYWLSIYSTDGKAMVRQMLGNGLSGDAATDIATGSMPHGVYVMTLSGQGQQVSRQFVL